jgi:hypothetical protein
VYLTSFGGQLTTAPGQTSTLANSSGLIGSLQFEGVSLSHPDVALWLTRLEEVTGWVNPWVSTETKSDEGVKFSGSVDLTQQAAESGARR